MFAVLFFKIIPTGFISRVFGYITRIEFPRFVLDSAIKKYIKTYGVNENEIEYPEGGFKTFDQFFTRRLKKGIHKIDSNTDSIVSPVDARIEQFGKISKDRTIQAKGIKYKVDSLIPSVMAERFINGDFITLYLSPADYHRIHSPANGMIKGYFYIPGKLFSVQEYMVNGIPGLFCRNERLITYLKNKAGLMAVCKIGAMNVGRISLSYARILTNKTFKKKLEIFFSQKEQTSIKKGSEIGIFHLGSTVILLFEKNMIEFTNINTGRKLRMGQRIAHIKQS